MAKAVLPNGMQGRGERFKGVAVTFKRHCMSDMMDLQAKGAAEARNL